MDRKWTSLFLYYATKTIQTHELLWSIPLAFFYCSRHRADAAFRRCLCSKQTWELQRQHARSQFSVPVPPSNSQARRAHERAGRPHAASASKR